MNKNTVKEILNKLSDKDFIEIFRENKNRIKQIEQKEKFEAVEQKFKEKGIQCPDCSSFLCTKYGSKDNKQRYKCKSCNITFHAFKNHYFYWTHLSYDQWNLLIQISTLGQSAYVISQFINTTKKTAWFNRQKFMKSPQLEKKQKQFAKLKGRIEIDETFIKLEEKIDKDHFKYAFSINTIGTEIPNLETTDKTIVGAINEIVKKQPSPSGSNWKDVAFADDKGYQINYELKNNTYYRIFYDNSIMISNPSKFPCLIKEFYWIKSDEVAPMDLWINIPCMGIGGKFENSLLIINKKRIFWQIKKQCDIWKLQELQG